MAGTTSASLLAAETSFEPLSTGALLDRAFRLYSQNFVLMLGIAALFELGVMGMLVMAALIEGFVSPSEIGFGVRVAVFVTTVAFWVGYLSLAGWTGRPASSDTADTSGR